MAAVQFAVGRTFSSFEKLEAEVKAYQNETFVQIVKRDTRTLEMARKEYQTELKAQILLWFTILYITRVLLEEKATEVKELGRGEIKGNEIIS